MHDGYLLQALEGEQEGVIEVHDLLASDPEAPSVAPVGSLRVGTSLDTLVAFDRGVLAVVEEPPLTGDRAYGRMTLALRALDLGDPAAPRWGETSTIEIDPHARWFGGPGPFVAVEDVFCHVGVCQASTRVFDLRDPERPREAGTFAHSDHQRPATIAWAGAGAADIDLVIDVGTGLALLHGVAETEGGASLSPVGHIPLPMARDAAHLAVLEDGTLVAARGTQLQLLEPAESGHGSEDGATSPHVLGHMVDLACDPRTRTEVMDLAVVGDLVLVAGWESGLIVIDASDPTAPRHLGCFLGNGRGLRAVATDYRGHAREQRGGGPWVYLAGRDSDSDDQRNAVWLVDLSRPEAPEISSAVALDQSETAQVADLAVEGGVAYVALAHGMLRPTPSLRVADLRFPAREQELDPPAIHLPATAVDVAEGIVAVLLRDCPSGSQACGHQLAILASESAPEVDSPEQFVPMLVPVARYGSLEADLRMLPSTDASPAPELWTADAQGIWAIDLSDPREPHPINVSWRGARRVVSHPDGTLLLVGEHGLRPERRMASWE